MLEIHEIRRDALEAHGSGYCNANFGSRFAAKAAHEGWIEALRALKNCGFNLRGHGNWDWPSYKTVDGPAQMAAKSGQFEAMRYLVESEGAFSEPSPFADENEAPWRARFPLLNAISETKSADIAQYLMNRFKLEPEEVWNDPYRLSLGKLKIAHACGLDVTTMDLRKIRRGSEIANYVELAREDKSARMKRSAMRL